MRFVISLSEQAMGALLTFAINLWMARHGHPEAYGIYAFWLAVAWVTGTAQSTLVTSHLMSLPHAEAHKRRGPERFFLTVQLAFIVLATCLTAIACGVMAGVGSTFLAMGAVAFMPGFLCFQYARALAFSRHQPTVAALLTGGTLTMAVSLMALCQLRGYTPTPNGGLLIAGAAYGVGAMGCLLWLMRGDFAPLGWRAMTPYRHYLHSSGWILMGAAAEELTNRLFSFVAAGYYGASALAVLTATQVTIRPAWMLGAAWSSVGLPRLAHLWQGGQGARFMRFLALGMLLPVVGSLVWSGLVAAGWETVARFLYHGKYAGAGSLIILWGGNVVLGSVLTVASSAFLAMRAFRPLAWTGIAGAVATSLTMVCIVAFLPFSYVVVGTMAGQAVQALLMGLVLYKARPAQQAAHG